MKAIAVFPGRREVKLIEQERPTLRAPTDVKLRMLDVGVCGTDREIAAFQYGTPPAGSEHLVIGHESLGEVVEVGSAVSSVKPGDLVITLGAGDVGKLGDTVLGLLRAAVGGRR